MGERGGGDAAGAFPSALNEGSEAGRGGGEGVARGPTTQLAQFNTTTVRGKKPFSSIVVVIIDWDYKKSNNCFLHLKKSVQTVRN